MARIIPQAMRGKAAAERRFYAAFAWMAKGIGLKMNWSCC